MQTSSHATEPGLISVRTMGRPIDIEYQWVGSDDPAAELIIFLHEGLGSVSMWRDWPARVCAASGCRGLAYSRYGYGQSTPRARDEPRKPDYLHVEAHDVLPALLSALGEQDTCPILYGHSDGGSIALLYAALFPGLVKAIAVAAPHIFVEDITLDGIRKARELYRAAELKEKLARHHRDVDSVLSAWIDTWLSPEFRSWNIEAFLGDILCPILAIQGVDDEYGTLEQIRGIARQTPDTRLLELTDCGHTPHRDQSDAVIAALCELIEEVRTPLPHVPGGR